MCAQCVVNGHRTALSDSSSLLEQRTIHADVWKLEVSALS